MATRVKLALIDSNALVHRAYHALPPMNTKAGVPTNAVYGFTTMLLKMFSTLKPTHVVATFDVKGPTFRKEKFAAYKAKRKPMDPELAAQFPLVKEVLKAFDIPIIELKGYEADDIIGTLVTQVKGDVKKVIVTGDMDTLQLVDGMTSVFTLRKGVTDTILYDPDTVRQNWGFGPEHVTDYKGLRGDPSDNIPGVKGVGEKTATELIEKYGTIESIYNHLEELPTRAKTRLEGQEKEALFSRELATIDRHVPIEFSLEAATLHGYDSEKVRDIFTKFEFRSLLSRLPQGGTAIQPSLFATKEHKKSAVALPSTYHVVESEAEQKDLLAELLKEKLVAFDTENDSLGAREFPIVGMSFAARRGKGHAVKNNKGIEAWYVPATRESVKLWKPLLESERVAKVGHNLKYDAQVLLMSGISLNGIVFDSMIGSYLLHPGSRQYGLDDMAVQELNYHPIPLADLIGEGKNVKKVSEVPLLELARYAAEDAEVALRLYEVLQPRIEKEGLGRVMSEIEVPLISVLAGMELNGVAVDVDVLKDLNKKLTTRIGALQKKIWKFAGEEFNINSTHQLRSLLFERLKLPTVDIKRTQSGFSTASSELEKLRGQHDIIPLVEEYRELTKLKNTYIETLPELVDATTGRIYTSFNQTIAATGRLSSLNPNLQNIPIRTETGQEIRRAFVAGQGNVLVKADYSQVELRLAAHLSQDEKMIDVFRAGEDIHRATAAWVYGIAQAEVTPDKRREAKTLNFGVLYGMGPQAFARAAGISVEKARSFIGRYREQYQGLTKYMEATIEQARGLGYVETLFGRKRYMPEIHSNNPAIAAQAERIAFNFPLQGTAADILKKAMIELQAVIAKHWPEVKLLLTVHDELVCEAPQAQAKEFAGVMKKAMEGVIVLDVPLIADVSIGNNWRDVEEVTF
jgi:DNA polymerase-1